LAPAVILQLSDIMRYMLYETNGERVELIKELEIINNILEIHQVRFGDSLTVEKIIKGEISEVKVAPLLFIPFVENAMKHGIEHLSDDGRLRVEISEDAQGLHFIIEDNGIGRKASAEISTHSTGVGLQVFSDFFEIMNHYNADKAGFKIEDLFSSDGLSSGTRVEMFIPSTYQYTIQ